MKTKILLVLITILFVGTEHAQYNSEGSDLISRFHPGSMWFYTGLRPAKTEKVRKYDRLMFDFTYNDWSGDQGPFENNWSSIGLNTNLMFDIPLAKKNLVGLGIGVQHSIFRINHNGFFYADSLNEFTQYTLPFSKNAEQILLAGNSFSVPFELRFRTKGWRHVKLHIGGKIGYQANMYSKVVSSGQNGREVNKQYGFADQNQLIYGVHARIGVRNWALYAAYNLNELFYHEKSIQLNLVQVGITLSLF